ncbi:MAG: hypothetical protein DRP26_03140 [Candidatus Zixiibacteriota bacterium]|nr:MAG: hypothetical protein DRP26_03140 [candidate division Zixibacteria bacterium]
MEKSIVGELIGKRGIVYAPVNQSGVLLIFSRLLDEFEMLVEETADDCSYLIARRRVDSGRQGVVHWEKIKILLVYRSSELKDNDDIEGDLLICWHHDWPDCPLEAFQLKSLFKEESSSKTELRRRPDADNRNNPGASLERIVPEDSREVLKGRGITQKRFEKAINELDQKIKKIHPEET